MIEKIEKTLKRIKRETYKLKKKKLKNKQKIRLISKFESNWFNRRGISTLTTQSGKKWPLWTSCVGWVRF